MAKYPTLEEAENSFRVEGRGFSILYAVGNRLYSRIGLGELYQQKNKYIICTETGESFTLVHLFSKYEELLFVNAICSHTGAGADFHLPRPKRKPKQTKLQKIMKILLDK